MAVLIECSECGDLHFDPMAREYEPCPIRDCPCPYPEPEPDYERIIEERREAGKPWYADDPYYDGTPHRGRP